MLSSVQYQGTQLVRSLFSAYLDDTLTASELIADDTTMYSRWCNGARPIPIDILKTYEDEDEWDTMEDDFRDKIIPNLLNEAQARIQMEELITDSIKTIGQEMADALIQEPDNAAFFCSVVRYAILNDHSTGALYSPDLSEVILCNKLPSCFRLSHNSTHVIRHRLHPERRSNRCRLLRQAG